MNQTIWKYQLAVVDEQTIYISKGAELLCVQVQNGNVCLWAKVDYNGESVPIKVVTVGTGHQAQHTEGMQYIGTYQLYDGGFVGHVFIKHEEMK